MAADERRTPGGNKMRAGKDRRKATDPQFKGPERRNKERRSEKERRKRT